MARLESEVEVACPCCQTVLVYDLNLHRVVRHLEPERADKPELNDAQHFLAEEQAKREALFEQSVLAEQTRGDVLSKRFEEALREANKQPAERPDRDFNLD